MAAATDRSALLGSIHHILKTAFKEFYVDEGEAGHPGPTKDKEVPGPQEQGAVPAFDSLPPQEPEAEDLHEHDPVHDNNHGEQGPESLSLSEESKAEISQIDQRLGDCRDRAENILDYLTVQHARAKVEDEVETDRLKKEGILVHAHIPIGPSHLELDQQVLQGFGKLGDNLLSAHALVEANHIAMLRRSGRIPVAEGIKKFDLQELLYVEPHYYQTTSNLKIRKQLSLPTSHGPHGGRHVPNQEGDVGHEPHPRKEDEATTQAGVEDGPDTKEVATLRPAEHDFEQVALDDIIRTRMASKLDFVKNPRYAKRSRTYQRSLVARVEEGDLGYMTAPLPQPPCPHHFDCLPWPVLFQEYEVDQPYEAVLAIRNVTAIKRAFRLLPPTTKYFSIVSVTYPEEGSRDIAPGIAAICRIRFVPDALANYEDEVVVVCESGEIHVPIMACRVHPHLTLPEDFNVGECLIGDFIRTSLEVVNLGGTGRFRLLTHDDYPHPRQSQDLLPTIQLPPFKLWPTEFWLRKGDHLQLNITYLPTSIGVHEARLLVLGDDCTLRELVVSASCTTVKLAVSEMEGVAMEYDALSQLDFNHIDFGAVPLGSSAHRSLAIRNRSSVSIGYEWKWLQNSPVEAGLAQAPFKIDPPSGCLEPQGTMKFGIEYSPTGITPEQGQLAFVLQQIPRTCVPLPGQEEQLEALRRAEEHRLFRLENWCRAARVINEEGALARGVLEQELFGPLLDGPHRYRIMDLLDVKYEMNGHETVPVDEIMALLPLEVKVLVESRLNVLDAVPEEPMPKEDIESTIFQLSGSGDFVEVSLHPASHHELPGELCPGKEYSFEIEVENGSGIGLDYQWGTPVAISDPDPDLATTSPRDEAVMEVSCSVVVEPSLAHVGPHERHKVKFTVVPSRTGRLLFRLPCTIVGFPPQVWPELTVLGHVVAPRVRFLEPEVDFGLLSAEGKVVKTLSFENESDVPVKWAMSQDFEGLLTEKVNDGSSLYASARSSARSNGSIYSKAMTDESGANQNRVSSVIFEPALGMLQPCERAVVTVTLQGGKMSERLRGRIACQVSDTVGGSEDHVQYLTYRGEIQELKVYLDKLHIDLGITYVDVPVKRTIIMTNVSNLTTRYKFEKPMEGAKNIDVAISPDSGPLSEKQVIKLSVTFVAKAPGVIDELYSCRVFGMNHPIGFQLKAVVKGVVVSYELLREGQPLPQPLAPPYEPQLPPGVVIPGAEVPPTLQFGGIPLFQRKRIRFLMRNLSAVPAVFRIRAKKYPSTTQPQSNIPPPPAFRNTMTGGVFSPSRTAKSRATTASRRGAAGWRVDDTHERMDRFKSGPGRDYLVSKYNKEQDREILSAGNGLALEITPNAGLLVPWGVTEVVVDSYNNMSGLYSDELECAVEGAPVLPLTTKIKVEGCPLSLRRECVGLDSTGPTAIVQFGEVCSRDQFKTKTITVQNSGPLDAMLTWQVLDTESKSDRIPMVAVTIRCQARGDASQGESRGPGGRKRRNYVAVKIEALKVQSHPVYAISPSKQTVRGFREASFTVTMKTPLPLGKYSAKLVADAEWRYPRKGFKTLGIQGAGTDKKTLSAVRMLAETVIIHPVLALDKRKHPEKGYNQYLKFEVASMEVQKASRSYRKGKSPSSLSLPPSMHRSFALTNPLTVPLTFTLDVAPPFRLLDASTATSHHLLGSTSSHPLTLGPHESVNLDLAFMPEPMKPSGRKRSDTAQLKVETEGTLTIGFSTGQTQDIFLRGVVLRPLLIAAPATYSFGTVHVEESVSFTLFISNPTLIEAAWKLVHVPSPPARRASMVPLWADQEAMRLRDDESVFSFSETQGVQKGPALPLKSSACLLPEDFNRIEDVVFPKNTHRVSWKDNITLEGKNRAENEDPAHRFGRPIVVTFSPKLDVGYKSTYRFEVDSGEGFDVVLSGYGTYEEDSVPARLPHI